MFIDAAIMLRLVGLLVGTLEEEEEEDLDAPTDDPIMLVGRDGTELLDLEVAPREGLSDGASTRSGTATVFGGMVGNKPGRTEGATTAEGGSLLGELCRSEG